MAAFVVNGTPVTVEKNQKLIRYLRDELHLTSVKDGCSEGACGTCHVLIDGKPTKACIPQTDKLEGKHIVTVEGLSDFEKEAFTYAFGEAGAVQCGFCIPGMVISAKGLHRPEPRPDTRRGRLCHPQQYLPLHGLCQDHRRHPACGEDFTRGRKFPKSQRKTFRSARACTVSTSPKRYRAMASTPTTCYVDGMCYGGAVRSQYPRARVLYIRTKEAEELPGVVCVLTAKDIPGQQNVGHIQKDQPYAHRPMGGAHAVPWRRESRSYARAIRKRLKRRKSSCKCRLRGARPRSTGPRRRPPPGAPARHRRGNRSQLAGAPPRCARRRR